MILEKIKNLLDEEKKSLIENICKDLEKEEYTQRMIYKYVNSLKNNTGKVTKTSKNKRKKTAYSMFLKYNNIRKEKPEMSLEEYNIYKGQYWKNISKEEKKIYENKALEWNKNNNKTDEIDDKTVVNENNKEKSKDLLDCFFDEEYMENKTITKKIEEI